MTLRTFHAYLSLAPVLSAWDRGVPDALPKGELEKPEGDW